jgi:archaeosine synthase beta-subunit
MILKGISLTKRFHTGKSFFQYMNNNSPPVINDQWILSNRGRKNNVSQQKPYSWLVEKERTLTGRIEDMATIFLTNTECSFHCLMCDLWQNTTDISSPPGSIPDQIEWALSQLPDVNQLKLYNSGSFFDERAIPEADYKRIAALTSHFETIIVESHPNLINDKCLRFKEMLKPALQVAVGLETIHPEILPRLNKRMTLEDFRKSVMFLRSHGISTRAFILLKPPFLSESEGIQWAERSIDFAFESKVDCCTVIPVRAGNGAMDRLQDLGFFTPPDIKSLEKVLEYGISLDKGMVLADSWDIEKFSSCDKCLKDRAHRLISMNLNQKMVEKLECSCEDGY